MSHRNTAARRVLIMLLTAACLLGTLTALSGCTTKADRENQRVVAGCNGFDVPYEELRFVTMMYKQNMEDTYGAGIWDDPETAETHRAELESEVKDHLRENYVILSACRAYGVDTESKAADNYVKEQLDKMIKESFGGRTSEYRDWLKEQHMTDHYLRFSLRVSFCESALFYAIQDSGDFFYTKKNLEDFIDYVLTSRDYARILHVYIKNEEGEDPEANRREAEKITLALRAVHNSADRLRVMSQYIGSAVNDDMDMVSQDGYYFTYGEMNETYEKAAFALDIGDVSDPISCSGGWFVLLRLQPEEDFVMRNSSTLLTNWQSARMGSIENTYREACEIIYNEEGLGIDLVAMQ